jgi:hypothetical protein
MRQRATNYCRRENSVFCMGSIWLLVCYPSGPPCILLLTDLKRTDSPRLQCKCLPPLATARALRCYVRVATFLVSDRSSTVAALLVFCDMFNCDVRAVYIVHVDTRFISFLQ